MVKWSWWQHLLAYCIAKIEQFLWKQHRPSVDFSSVANDLSVSFINNSLGSLAWWWDFGDGTFSNDQNPTHDFAAAGSYNVKLYVENTIKSWNEITKPLTVSLLATNTAVQTAFKVFPLPTHDELTIQNPLLSNGFRYTLSDISGKILREDTLQTPIATISLSAYTKGLYFLKLTADEASLVVKIVKE